MSFLFEETAFNLPDEISYSKNRSWTGLQFCFNLGVGTFNLAEAYLKKAKTTRTKEEFSKIVNDEFPCRDRLGHPLIHYCKRSDRDRSIVRLFLENGYRINMTDYYGDNLLSACLQPGLIDMRDLEYILQRGADVTIEVPNRRSIAHMASNVSVRALELVLKFGAKPHPTEKSDPKLKDYLNTVKSLKYLARRVLLRSLINHGGLVKFLEHSEFRGIVSSLFDDQ